jgi:hypothetical protein
LPGGALQPYPGMPSFAPVYNSASPTAAPQMADLTAGLSGYMPYIAGGLALLFIMMDRKSQNRRK